VDVSTVELQIDDESTFVGVVSVLCSTDINFGGVVVIINSVRIVPKVNSLHIN
jgi:hypothetical protein